MDRETIQELRKAADIAGLSMEFSELLVNAERYEWLRDRCAWTMCSANGMVRIAHRLPIDYKGCGDTAHEMDDAVDQAMAAQ